VNAPRKIGTTATVDSLKYFT